MPQSLNRPILVGFGTQLAATALHLVVVLLIARLLGPTGQGQLATALLPPQLLVVCLNLGLGQALIFYLNRGEIAPAAALVLCRRLFALVVPIGLMAALLLQWLAGERLYPGIPGPLLLAALPLLPAILARQWWGQLLQARHLFRWYHRLQLLQPLLLLTLILASLVARGRLDPLIVVLLMAASHAIAWSVAALALARSIEGHDERPAGIPAGFLRRCLSYGLPSLGSNLLEFINLRSSLLLVNGFLGPLEAGLFKLDTQLGEPLLLPASAASAVLLPRLSDHRLDAAQRLAVTSLWLRRVLAVGLGLAGMVLLAAPLMVPALFGPAYREALPVLPWLLPAYLSWSAVNLLWIHLSGSGQPRRPMELGLITLALHLLANLVLIPRLGLPGAALASTLAFTVAALLSWAAVQRSTPRTAPSPAP